MGKYANSRYLTGLLLIITAIVTLLNFKLLYDILTG
jgi:Mn2+/Fe2+ NRAMP family transporter